MEIIERVTIEVDGQTVAVQRLSDGTFLKPDYLRQAKREAVGLRYDGARSNNTLISLNASPSVYLETTPATDAAKQWSGWGTALKPAHEPIVLARKPLIGTVAENVLQHGTGALNIDGCRIEIATRDAIHGKNPHTLHQATNTIYDGFKAESTYAVPDGRWPANIITDGSDEVLAGFPAEAGGDSRTSKPTYDKGIWGHAASVKSFALYNDSGSAARFFYCAKADRFDRDEGLDDLPLLSPGQLTNRKDGSAGLTSPRAGAGRANSGGGRNAHPTVKPTALMRYLCRLITPPNGLILDPFAGSGSTGKAAAIEGFRTILIEVDPDYCELAKHRVQEPPSLFNPLPKESESEPAMEQTTLFSEAM